MDLNGLVSKELSRVEQWHDYFMGIAEKASEMATCDRLHVGCVIVKDKRVIATGFNGSICGHAHCDDVGHLYNDEGRCIRTVHAEQNAILDCARRGVATDGAVAYCTHEPCEHCTRSLVQAGIKAVYFKHRYVNKWNKHFNKDIKWVHLK
ncbi:deoxycytidylate deaminase [Pseudobacillus badius]|uniref:deoxycytidylate deaminase n=1 Tax=Bacillus badius TaxID=1455 RepID=UPI000ADF50DA|nr:cytidine/deoxycytidylate deaminase family protein [Bacillus badius]